MIVMKYSNKRTKRKFKVRLIVVFLIQKDDNLITFDHFMHIQFFFFCVSSEKLFQIFQSQLDWISISHFFSCSQRLTQELIYMLCWNGQRIKIAVDNDDKHANLMRLMFFFLSILAHVKCVEISFARRTKKNIFFRSINTSILADVSHNIYE